MFLSPSIAKFGSLIFSWVYVRKLWEKEVRVLEAEAKSGITEQTEKPKAEEREPCLQGQGYFSKPDLGVWKMEWFCYWV